MPQVYLPRRMDRAFARLAANSREKALLLFNNPAYVSFWDDFFGDALDARWSATSGTGTEVVGITAGIGGTMTLTTGANADDSAGVGAGLHWKGDNGIYMIVRAKIDSVATAKFEIGLSDAMVSRDTGAVAVKATPTFTATDWAGFVFDTTDDTLVTFTSNGGTSDGNADGPAAAADAYSIYEILVNGPTATTGDFASGYINGNLIGSGNINGATAVGPWLYVETNTTATRTLTVDYVGCISPRV